MRESLEGDNRTVLEGRFVGVENDAIDGARCSVCYVQVGRDITRRHDLRAYCELDRLRRPLPELCCARA